MKESRFHYNLSAREVSNLITKYNENNENINSNWRVAHINIQNYQDEVFFAVFENDEV